MSSTPDCVGKEYWGQIFAPGESGVYNRGDPLEVRWYLGKESLFDQDDATYPFKVNLRSAYGETNRPIITENVYGKTSSTTQRFTACGDYQINESITIPAQLNVTNPIFAVVIEYVGTRELPGWDLETTHTGRLFHINPTEGPTSPSSTSTSSSTSTPTSSSSAPAADPSSADGGNDSSGGDSGSGGNSVAVAAGVGVGVAVVVIGLCIATWWFVVTKRRRRMKDDKEKEQQAQQQQQYLYDPAGGAGPGASIYGTKSSPGTTVGGGMSVGGFQTSPSQQQQQMYGAWRGGGGEGEERQEMLANHGVHELPKDLKSPVWEMGGMTPAPGAGGGMVMGMGNMGGGWYKPSGEEQKDDPLGADGGSRNLLEVSPSVMTTDDYGDAGNLNRISELPGEVGLREGEVRRG